MFGAAEDDVDGDDDAMSTAASGSGDWSARLESEASRSERTHVRLLSSSRGIGKKIIPATFTGVDTNVRQQLHHTRSVRLWISSCAGVSVSHHSYSTQQTESTEEETLHSIISDTENIQGSYSKHKFQAETKKLLDIMA
ncbi:heat shock 75 mitochondrial [Labeo rohita]|uniref:Heat shock 75 mitochondrial n=1 Tax=Labeo rohita TaxID=84645 RepID=A0A498LZH8_LABRO|nr:heat shock 75 mitochondrial [Labeo rohita]